MCWILSWSQTTEVFLAFTKRIADNFCYKCPIQHWLLANFWRWITWLACLFWTWTCWICFQFKWKHLVFVSNLHIILFNLKIPEFFLVDFQQAFLWNLFCLKIFVLLFCSSGSWNPFGRAMWPHAKMKKEIKNLNT